MFLKTEIAKKDESVEDAAKERSVCIGQDRRRHSANAGAISDQGNLQTGELEHQPSE